MLLYRTTTGIRLQVGENHHAVEGQDWDGLWNAPDLQDLLDAAAGTDPVAPPEAGQLLPPMGSQEVWAAGVTYYRSRTARMEESEDAGGGTFYDRVYEAERPEIFFKATAQRTVGPGQAMHLRSDSDWIVPEPELTLALNGRGERIGYTIGNDLSCRDIEGQNPLYLPQAKCFKDCAAVGPAILVQPDPLPKSTQIQCRILRRESVAFEGTTELGQLKRGLDELGGFLFRDNTFSTGALLMTGTGIVPPDDFSLRSGDVVEITIDGVGTLSNPMA